MNREVLMKAQNHVDDPLCIGGGGAEEFALVVLERLYPMVDVAGVLGMSVGMPSSAATQADASSARNSSIA